MEKLTSLAYEKSEEQSIEAIIQVVQSSKRLYKDRYATISTEIKRKGEYFNLPTIGANILLDHYSCKEEVVDSRKDEKYDLNDFMNGFNDITSGGAVEGGNKPLADYSTMAVAGDQLSSMQIVEARCAEE